MVRLVWFPGYMDWERRSTLGKYEGKRGRSRSEVICTMCIPSNMKRKCKLTFSCLYIAHFAIRNIYRFPKLEAGGRPETKHFIGVAL